MRVTMVLSLALLMTLTGNGCEPKPAMNKASSWTKVDGFEFHTITSDQSSSTIGVLYAFDPSRTRFSVERASPKTIAEWQQQGTTTLATINGSYFHEDYSPSGMVVDEQKEVSTRRFDLEKSSLVRLDPQPDILDFDEYTAAIQSKESIQSFPLLLWKGKTQIEKDSGKLARRSFIAKRDDGALVMGVISNAEISLYELAKLLTKKEYRLISALNLDGGPSTGLLSHTEAPGYNSFSEIPFVIQATKR